MKVLILFVTAVVATLVRPQLIAREVSGDELMDMIDGSICDIFEMCTPAYCYDVYRCGSPAAADSIEDGEPSGWLKLF